VSFVITPFSWQILGMVHFSLIVTLIVNHPRLWIRFLYIYRKGGLVDGTGLGPQVTGQAGGT
jgi:hypothetical protein